jgi:hypothetical protein
MRYFLIRDATNILAIHKIYDSALALFQQLQMNRAQTMELVRITTDECGQTIETLVLQSYDNDTGTRMHMLRIHAPT